MVKKKKITLEERDFEILKHVSRYRMTVLEALEQMPFFSGDKPHAAKEAVRRLRSGGYLKSASLYRNRRYYHLTRAAANVLDEPPTASRPLTEEPKARAYAMLAFCVEHGLEKLTLSEFRSYFSKLYREGERPNYYVDSRSDINRLGFMRVDHGGFGRWDRLIGKLKGDIQKRCDLPDFRELISDGRFIITVLTALERKQDRIYDALLESPLPCVIEVHVVPGLLELIAPAPESRAAT